MRKHASRATLDDRGISLVEVLVAIIILGGALASIAAAGGHAARQVAGSRRDLNVSAAVQSQMETLRTRGYKGISSGNTSADTAVVNGYWMEWTVSGEDPKEVVLEVHWTNRAGTAVRDTVILNFPSLDTL